MDDSIPVNLAYFPSVVTVRLRDGRELTARVDIPKGYPERPLTDAEVVEKARECSEGFLGQGRFDELVSTVLHLEEVPDIAMLAALLGKQRSLSVGPRRAHRARRALADAPHTDGDKPFIRFGSEVASYDRVHRNALEHAASLARIGVERSELVALMLPNSIEYVELYFGIAYSGRGRRARQHRVSRPHARVRPERCCVPGADRRRGVPAGTARIRRPAFTPADGPRAGRRLHRRSLGGPLRTDRGCCDRGGQERPRPRPAGCFAGGLPQRSALRRLLVGDNGTFQGHHDQQRPRPDEGRRGASHLRLHLQRHAVFAASALLLDGPAPRRALRCARRVEHRPPATNSASAPSGTTSGRTTRPSRTASSAFRRCWRKHPCGARTGTTRCVACSTPSTTPTSRSVSASS